MGKGSDCAGDADARRTAACAVFDELGGLDEREVEEIIDREHRHSGDAGTGSRRE